MMILDHASAPLLAGVLAAGIALGLLHFGSLRAISRDYLGSHPVRAFALQLVRMAIMAGMLFGLARLGAADLLAGALGVLIARAWVIGRVRREP